ncbi:MAG: type II toxin-antitoxin system RelE/ParE family toxin [Deltaproteobacteria bacterium]|nr:type II toxin-antitoxin system RelE/ParE family toxin [Deltaproteobacteria bacterium]
MSYRVRVSDEAEADLAALVDFIAVNDNVTDALRVEARILAALTKLESAPRIGRIVPELQRQGVSQYREIVESPWRIMFRVVKREVRVVAIIDGRRDVYSTLHERLRR